MTRSLIVNADDFGQSDGLTRGIAEAHECGIVTSASLMVMWPAAAAAAAYARAHPTLSVGLHVDLGEWIRREAGWQPLYQRVDCADTHAVEVEVHAQLARCRELLGRKPTHLDSHQHVHRREPVRSILRRAADSLGVPLRECTPAVRHCGAFYGQTADGQPLPDRIDVTGLLAILAALGDGVTELVCHPGYPNDLDSMYLAERRTELRTLCAPAVRAALLSAGIHLISFGELVAS